MYPLAFLHMFIRAQNVCHFLLKSRGEHWSLIQSDPGLWSTLPSAAQDCSSEAFPPPFRNRRFPVMHQPPAWCVLWVMRHTEPLPLLTASYPSVTSPPRRFLYLTVIYKGSLQTRMLRKQSPTSYWPSLLLHSSSEAALYGCQIPRRSVGLSANTAGHRAPQQRHTACSDI